MSLGQGQEYTASRQYTGISNPLVMLFHKFDPRRPHFPCLFFLFFFFFFFFFFLTKKTPNIDFKANVRDDTNTWKRRTPFHIQQLVAQELAQERVRRRASAMPSDAPAGEQTAAEQPEEESTPTGYSLQSKTSEEKQQFIKARMGLSKEVSGGAAQKKKEEEEEEEEDEDEDEDEDEEK